MMPFSFNWSWKEKILIYPLIGLMTVLLYPYIIYEEIKEKIFNPRRYL